MQFLRKLAFSLHWLVVWRSIPVKSWIDASFLLRRRRFEEAIEKYVRGIERHPRHPAVPCIRLNLSFCYSKTWRNKEAVEQLQLIAMKHPCYSKAVLRLARLEIWLCRPEEAVRVLRKALDVIPPSAELAGLYLTACLDAAIDNELLSQAHEMASQAAEQSPNSPLLQIALRRFEWLSYRSLEAKAYLYDICERNSSSIDALLGLGEILLMDGNVEASRQLLRQALSLSPNHPKVQSLLAMSYLLNSPYYSPDYAAQLAVSSCQHTLWESVYVMRILLDAYRRLGKDAEASLIRGKILHIENHKPREEKSAVRKLDLAA